MKCIKFYRPYGGHVVKVSDAEALKAVAEKRAMYAPKHWLKAAKLREETEGHTL